MASQLTEVKVKWSKGYPQHWHAGEGSMHISNELSITRADLLALHHICSMPFTTLPFDLMANSDHMFDRPGESS